MHALKPNTEYQLVTVTLACPLEIGVAGMADAINDMLNAGIAEHGSECVFHDWSNNFCGPVKKTDDSPEEGDLF